MADWRWDCVTDDLLDGLPPDALLSVQQLAKELAVRESMIFLDGAAFTGDPPGQPDVTQRAVLAPPRLAFASLWQRQRRSNFGSGRYFVTVTSPFGRKLGV